LNYMGVDHHKQYSHVTVMNERGDLIRSGRIFNLRRDVEELLEEIGGEVAAVIEAGRGSYMMSDLLEELGVRVTVAHPQGVKAIAHAKIKTDARDSEVLAHLLRTELVPEVYRRGPENREALRVLRQRAFYVAALTAVKNRIHALIVQQREEVQVEAGRYKDLFTQEGKKFLERVELRATDRALLDALLETSIHLSERIKDSDKLVRHLYREKREAQLIDTVPGFAEFLSVLVAVEIADIERFSSAAKLHAYAGLIPSTHTSGERSYHGRIIKAGNHWLRWAMTESVSPALRKDHDLRVFHNRLARRKGANPAKMATARRLLTIIWRVLKENRTFIPYPRKKELGCLRPHLRDHA